VREAKAHIDGLIEIHRVDDDVARLGVWRQSVAALAAEAVDLRPVPLEGIDPHELEAGLRAALSHGLVDDLDWLSPPHAAAALYELAGALPMGDVRRELGRRVLRYLHEGGAETFAILAAQLSLGSRKGLSGPAVRARVALTMDVAAITHGRAEVLALSLLSHPDLVREWISAPSTGALPSRRLAAQILECAALQVVRRRAREDDQTVAIFDQPDVAAAWQRLLSDREPLVWRHVAIARGVLAAAMPHYAHQVERTLDPALTPFEWRRAATSLGASVAIDPVGGLARCLDVLRGEVLQRDPGVASAMVLGLPWALESEPDAANRLLCTLLEIGNIDTLESFGLLLRDHLGTQFVTSATEAAKKKIGDLLVARTEDDGRVALLRAVASELGADQDGEPIAALGELVSQARLAFAEQDARAAHARGLDLLASVARRLESLTFAPATPEGRRHAFLALRDLDRAMLESQTLVNLLWLGSSSAEVPTLQRADALLTQLAEWMCHQESSPIREAEGIEHLTLRQRRFGALLHFVDGALGLTGKPASLRERRLRVTRLLLERIRDDAPSQLRRVVCAAAARACDALLREEDVELSDVLIAVAFHVMDASDILVLSEASMEPVASRVLRAHAEFVQRKAKAARMTGQRVRVSLESIGALTRSLPVPGTQRVEALREVLVRLVDVVQTVHRAQTLSSLGADDDLGPSPMSAFADVLSLVTRLTSGARRRMGLGVGEGAKGFDAALRVLDIGLARALREDDPKALQHATDVATRAIRDVLPSDWADVALDALDHVSRLPVTMPFVSGVVASQVPLTRAAPLPPWLPPNRVIGGFHVLRPLGTGSVGSVFAVCRAEEKGLPHAPRFALKVPEYGGDVARALSQEEFLRLFREEAGALLSVPDHPNLARLVTFDAGARPKPILVMELVEGLTLQRLIDTASLGTTDAFAVLDGVAAGLEAMHSVGVGHLDIKPSNVILREANPGEEPSDSRDSQRPPARSGTPVLVDFGLAGRQIRPGCATVHYGSPELWGLEFAGLQPSPVAVDIYAFGCLVYETLFGRELFDGPSQMAVVSKHIQHDGDLPVLRAMMRRTDFSQLAAVIRDAVRRDPRDRATLPVLRHDLRQVAIAFQGASWPLSLDKPPRAVDPMKSSVSRALPLVRKRITTRE
jgi:serine/threonine protein kinase